MENFKICNKFFQSFQEKNIKNICEMIHKSIELKDWEIVTKGDKKFLEGIQKIFDSVDSISIIIKNQGIQSDEGINSVSVFNEIEIYLNNNEKLEVVDIIEIELKTKLIKSIRAYKR
jgi:hypothetical protein